MDETPKRIAKYEIFEEIGRGGYAVVYKARDVDLDRIVALKVMAPHLVWEATFVRRFRAEFETVAKLRHAHIVSVYEYGEDKGQPFIAMEFIPGLTLGQLLEKQKGPLPLNRTLDFAQQIASALSFAQRRGVVHRDIKPSNIMVDAEQHIKLTDFGIAKVAARTVQTTTGRIFGSPEYMSPEQVKGEELDHRSDIYSLGVVLYTMVTGRAPFVGGTPQAVMFGHYEREPPPPSKLNPDLPASVEAVLLKALAKSPSDRFQSARELVHHLSRAIEGKPLVLDTRPPDVQESAKGFNWSCLGIALGVLVSLVVLVVLAWTRDAWWPIPTESPAIGVVSVPTETPTSSPLAPTATRTPLPTDTLRPTATWTTLPTSTPWVVTAIPHPAPTNTPAPTSTPTTEPPTAIPTDTETPTDTPEPVDSDGDGLTDGRELELGTDPMNPDSDHDGLTDGEEVNVHGTSAISWDTDGDRLPDEYELTLQTDPKLPSGCQPSLAVCDAEGVTQPGDSLTRWADKYYGSVYAYPVILYYTNLKHEQDPSYGRIIRVSLDAGIRLCIPSVETAEAYLACQ